MSTSLAAARPVVYVIISAMEADMRSAAVELLNGKASPESLLGADRYLIAYDKLSRDQGAFPREPSLAEILDYSDFLDPLAVVNQNKSLIPVELRGHFADAYGRMEKLVQVRNRVMHRRPLNFEDLFGTREAAEAMALAQPRLWAETATTLSRLDKDPSWVLGVDIPVAEDERSGLHNLPIPDFDETGFLGRKRTVADVVSAVRGTWPVVSVIGEGGVGKTALALKVAYEILDSDPCPFEQIVWVSAKRFYLHGEQIEEIREAVRDTAGVIADAASVLGPGGMEDAESEVIDYLGFFRILLIIDNVETILDDSLTKFLRRLPLGSKVLITSRIGIGAMEYRIDLSPMEPGDAVQLLRAVASVRGVESLRRTSQDALRDYAKRMDNNPGWIKWFVAAVQAGRRPEEVLAHSDLFLDFCMSNVYEHLTNDARNLLGALVSIGQPLGQSELEHLTGMDVDTLQKAVHQLLTTNMVQLEDEVRGGIQRTTYVIGELALKYLTRQQYPTAVDDRLYRRRWQQLSSEAAKAGMEHERSPFRIDTFLIRTLGDAAVVKYLRESLELAQEGKPDEASAKIEAAETLAPDYFEVFRVKGHVRTRAKDTPGARSAYYDALRLQPDHVPLLRAYGIFLKGIQELEEAERYLRRACELMPDNVTLHIELSLCLVEKGEFALAEQILQHWQGEPSVGLRERSRLLSVRLLCALRQVDSELRHPNCAAAVRSIQNLFAAYRAVPRYVVDYRVVAQLEKVQTALNKCLETSEDATVLSTAASLLDELSLELEHVRGAGSMVPGKRYGGVVDKLWPDRSYGFIRTDYGAEAYFHRATMRVPGQWLRLSIGNEVSFVLNQAEKGPQADDVVVMG